MKWIVDNITTTFSETDMHGEERMKPEHLEEVAELRRRLAELGSSVASQRLAAAQEQELLKYKALFDNISDLAYICDTEGKILYVNKAFERLTGYSTEEFIGRSFDILLSERDREIAREVHSATLRGERPQYELCFKDTGILCEYKNMPLKDQQGRIIGVAGIARDITEHRRTEEALRESEERYRSLFEESKDTVFISSPDGNFLDINPAGLELFGYSSKEEFMAVDIDRDIYLDPADRKRFMEEINRHGFVKDFEVVLKRKDGAEIIASITANTVHGKDGKVVAYRGILRDMTECKRLEAQLIHAQKMEAVGELTGGIAHDFNNILTTIMGYADMLNMKLGGGDPLKVYVEQILNATERAKNLTQGLLAFSRKQIIDLKPVNINEVISSFEKLLSRVIGEDIEFMVSLADEDLTVMADSVQIEQVLVNLATNARDAMPDGGLLTVCTEYAEIDDEFIKAHGYGERGPYACITVTDTGVGMSEETCKKIFEPFFTTKEVGKGTGLGLSIVYGIVKQHNGYIDVHSRPGEITEFKIYLPLVESKAGREEQRTVPAPVSGTETVLVAEDSAELRTLTKIALEEFGYRVIEAVNGEDAVIKFMEHRDEIELLILDVIMPRKNGREAYSEIAKEAPGVKVIFTSGYTEDIIDKKLLGKRGLHFVSKPVTPKELLRKVREVLDEGADGG